MVVLLVQAQLLTSEKSWSVSVRRSEVNFSRMVSTRNLVLIRVRVELENVDVDCMVDGEMVGLRLPDHLTKMGSVVGRQAVTMLRWVSTESERPTSLASPVWRVSAWIS